MYSALFLVHYGVGWSRVDVPGAAWLIWTSYSVTVSCPDLATAWARRGTQRVWSSRLKIAPFFSARTCPAKALTGSQSGGKRVGHRTEPPISHVADWLGHDAAPPVGCARGHRQTRANIRDSSVTCPGSRQSAARSRSVPRSQPTAGNKHVRQPWLLISPHESFSQSCLHRQAATDAVPGLLRHPPSA